jgi:hypothetical protein
MDNGTLTSGDLFGTRRAMKNNYLNRRLGTIGIYGNSKQEAIYPIYRIDADGQKLSGRQPLQDTICARSIAARQRFLVTHDA